MQKSTQKQEMYATHRKCLKCRYTTTELNKTKCEVCGANLYLISSLYSPKVVFRKKQ